MKRIILVAVILSFFTFKTYSQNDPKLFYFGAGVGFGFFYPTEINDLLNDYYSNTMTTMGSYDMYVYYVLNVKGSFFFSKYTELQIEAEWGFSPKFISIDSDFDTYFYRRITPAVKFNLHIPVGGRTSIFLGPGISWNSLRFNTPNDVDLKGTCIGFSGQGGAMIRFSKWAIAPFIIFNYIDAETDEIIWDEYGYTSNINLNYTGVQLGNTFFF